MARAEAGDDVPLEDSSTSARAVIRRVVIPPSRCSAIWRGLDRLVQARIDECPDTLRCAATGTRRSEVSQKTAPGELRCARGGKWRIFFSIEPPALIRVLGIDNRGEAY